MNKWCNLDGLPKLEKMYIKCTFGFLLESLKLILKVYNYLDMFDCSQSRIVKKNHFTFNQLLIRINPFKINF
jgi:hypothetical protein